MPIKSVGRDYADRASRQQQFSQEGSTIDEEAIHLRRYFGVFVGFWWLFLILTAVGAAAAYSYSKSQTPVYEATATILVEYRGTTLTLGTGNFQQSEQLAATYSRLLDAKPFLSSIQLDGASVSASTESNPPTMRIRVRHRDPDEAATMAEVVVEEFIMYAMERRLAEIARVQSAAAAYGLTAPNLAGAQLSAVDSLSLLESVSVPRAPVVPRTRQNTFLGALLGLVLAVTGSLVLASLRDTVRFPEHLESRFGVVNLGIVFAWKPNEAVDRRPVLSKDPGSNHAESIRQLRANLEFATASHTSKVYVVTSPGPAEGKSTIASNLAIALAQTGKKTLLIDGDMRRPSLHKGFSDVSQDPGLSNYLADFNLDETQGFYLKQTNEGVDLIPSGPIPPNPGEILASGKLGSLLDKLKDRYDIILLDSPPSLPVADASVMAAYADGVVMVVDGRSTKPASLKAGLEVMRKSNTQVLGVVINKFSPPRFGYGSNYYHYYSEYRYHAGEDDISVNSNGALAGRIGLRAKRALSRLRRR